MKQNRRVFIQSASKICAFSLLTVTSSTFLHSCKTIKIVNASIENGNKFIINQNLLSQEQPFIKVRNLSIPYDILVFLNDKKIYEAIYMKCSHQDNPVYFDGKQFNCPTHGSSFTKTGIVLNGPANQNLKNLRTETKNENLIIYLN